MALPTRELLTIWDISEHFPDIFEKLKASERDLALFLQEFENRCPIPPTCRLFEESAFFRPQGHTRTFYHRFRSNSVLAFKGAEPFTPDYAETIQQAWRARPARGYSPQEHFVLFEQQVFLATAKAGGVRCADRTGELLQAYLCRFGRFPKIPVPIRLLMIPDDITQDFLRVSRPFLSDRLQISARQRTEELAAGGLCIYVYYYPGIPFRAAHAIGRYPGAFSLWDGVSGTGTPDKFMLLDPKEAIPKWINLACELLAIGYLPTAPLHTGNVLQLQNLVVDGGMCDVDSVEPFSNISNKADFARALIHSVYELSQSIRDIKFPRAQGLDEIVYCSIWSAMGNHLSVLNQAQALDPRIQELFGSNGVSLMDMMEQYLLDHSIKM